MATLYMTREEYEKKYGVKAPTTSTLPSSISTTTPATIPGVTSTAPVAKEPIRMTREEYEKKYGVPAPTKAEIETGKPETIFTDDSWWGRLRRGEPTWDANPSGGAVENLARYTGNIPGSVVNLARNVTAPVNPFDLEHPFNIGAQFVKQNDKIEQIMESEGVSRDEAISLNSKEAGKKIWNWYKKLGEKALKFGTDRAQDDSSAEAWKATGYGVAEIFGQLSEAVIEDPTLIPTLIYAPGKLTDKYGKLTLEKGVDGTKLYRNAAGDVVSVVDKEGAVTYGTKLPDDAITKIAKPVIQGTKAVAKKVAGSVVAPEKALSSAINKTADIYRDSLPFTPTQRAKEASQLAKTGEDTATVLAKNGIELGSGNEMVQLEQLQDLYRKADESYQKTETALFNVQNVIKKFEEHIDSRMKVPTSRTRAKAKIKMEVRNLLNEPTSKADVVVDANGNVLVRSALMERMRMMGNEMAKYKDMENIGRDMGYAFANAVRDEIERASSFAARRAMMREWGSVIHAEEQLDAMFKAGKQFRRVGGLSGSIARKVLSGLFGYHMGGIPGAILAELGSEYAATVLSNPMMRTWYSRRVTQLIRGGKVTPEALEKLKGEITAYKAKVDEAMRKGLALPAPSGKTPIPMNAPGQQPMQVVRAKKTVGRDPKTGKFKVVYTSEADIKSVNSKLQEAREKKNGGLRKNKKGGYIANPFVRGDVQTYLPSSPRGRNLTVEAEAALEKFGFDTKADVGALELIRTWLKPEKGDFAAKLSRTDVATAIDIINGTALVKPTLAQRLKNAWNNPKFNRGFAKVPRGKESPEAKLLRTREERQVSSTNDSTLESNTWYRGETSTKNGDSFFSASEDVAGDYGKVRKMTPDEMPKKPLVVSDKTELAEKIGYKGDPYMEPKGMKDNFDDVAKAYAQKQGYDSIIYRDGSLGEPELHIFRKNDTLMAEAKKYKTAEEFVKNNTVTVYHGTNDKFSTFSPKKGAQGVIWFTDNPEVIKMGESGAQGTKFIMERQLTGKKWAGWDEYEKFGLGQIKEMGFDGIKLPNKTIEGDIPYNDYVLFDNKGITTKKALTDIWKKANNK